MSSFNYSEFEAASNAFVLCGDRQASTFIETILTSRCHRLRDWYEQLCQYSEVASDIGSDEQQSQYQQLQNTMPPPAPTFDYEMLFPHFVEITSYLSQIIADSTSNFLAQQQGNPSSATSSSTVTNGGSFSPALFTSVLLIKRFAREWLPQFVSYEKRIRYLRSGGRSKKQQQNTNTNNNNNNADAASSSSVNYDTASRQLQKQQQQLERERSNPLHRQAPPNLVDPMAMYGAATYAWILEASPTTLSVMLHQQQQSAHLPITFSTRLLALLVQLRSLITQVAVVIISQIQNRLLGITTTDNSGSTNGTNEIPISVWSRDPVVKMLLHTLGVLEVLIWTEEPSAGAGNERKRSRRFGNTEGVVGGATAVRFSDICQETLCSDICSFSSSPNVLENVMGHFTTIAPDFFHKLSTSSTPLNASADGSNNSNSQTLAGVASQLIGVLCSQEQSQQQHSPTSSSVANRIITYYQRVTSLLYLADKLSDVSSAGLSASIAASSHHHRGSQNNGVVVPIAFITPFDVTILGSTNIMVFVLYIIRNTVECLSDRRICIDFMLRARIRASMQLGRENASQSATTSTAACASILAFIDNGLEQLLGAYNGIFSPQNPSVAPFPTIAAAISGTTQSILTYLSATSSSLSSNVTHTTATGATMSPPMLSPSSPFWPSSLATILFYIELTTETLTMCISAGIETASLAGQIGVTNSSYSSKGSSGAGKPVSPWGEAFWLMLSPLDPLGLLSNNRDVATSPEAFLMATECDRFHGTAPSGAASPIEGGRVCQSLLWDFILKSGFVQLRDGMSYRAPLIFSLSAAVRQLLASFNSLNASSAAAGGGLRDMGELANLLLRSGLSNFATANTTGSFSGDSGGGGGSACLDGLASPLVASQVRVLSRTLQPYINALGPSPTTITALCGSPSTSSSGGSTCMAIGATAGVTNVSDHESCPSLEVAMCDFIVKLFEVIGIEGTCSVGCGTLSSSATDGSNTGGGGGEVYNDDENYYEDAYASSEYYLDVCAVASAAITRGMRFVQPQNASFALAPAPRGLHDVSSLMSGASGGLADAALASAAVCNLFIANVSSVSLKPLFLSIFMGISEAAVPLLDATTEKYAVSAIEISCQCACNKYPMALLQQQTVYNGPEEVTSAIISAGNASLKHALFTAFTTTLTQVISDSAVFSVTPPISSPSFAALQQQQPITASVPIAFPLISSLTQRSQPVTAVNPPPSSSFYSSQTSSGGGVGKGSISVVRVLDIRLCAALETVSASLSGLTMIAQALAPQSIPPMDEEADDPEDFGFSVVDHIDGENVRKRLTIAGLFSSASSSVTNPGNAYGNTEAPLLLPADSFFIAAAAKIASHCISSYATTAKIEREMKGSSDLVHTFLTINGNNSIDNNNIGGSSSLLLNDLLLFLTNADDSTLMYGTEFHETALHILGDAAAVGGGGGGDDNFFPSATSSFATALKNTTGVPVAMSQASIVGALDAEALLNIDGSASSASTHKSLSSSSAFKTGIVDIHKHSIACFVSTFMHLSALANTSVTTRRSILLHLVIGAMGGQARGRGGLQQRILAPLTADLLPVGRNGNNAANGADQCGSIYMTAHDDEDLGNAHQQELAQALHQMMNSANSTTNPTATVGAVIIPIVIDPFSDPPEKTVQMIMSLMMSNNNNNYNTSTSTGSAIGSGAQSSIPNAKTFVPLSTLYSLVCNNTPSGVSGMDVLTQQNINISTDLNQEVSSPIELGAILQQQQQQQPPSIRQLSSIMERRAAVIHADVLALLMEAACLPSGFAVLRAKKYGSGGCSNLHSSSPPFFPNVATAEQSRLASLCSHWLTSSASSPTANSHQQHTADSVPIAAIDEVTKRVDDYMFSLWSEEGSTTSANLGKDKSEDDEIDKSAGSGGSTPFPSLLSMPSITEVSSWIQRLQSLLLSLRHDATITIPSFFEYSENAFASNNNSPSPSAPRELLVSGSLSSDFIVICQSVEIYWHRVWQVLTVMCVRAERCLAGESILHSNGYANDQQWPQWLLEEYARSRALLSLVDGFWQWFGTELFEATTSIGNEMVSKMQLQSPKSGTSDALHRYRDQLCRLAHSTFSIATSASDDQLKHHTPAQVRDSLVNVQRPQRLHNYFVNLVEATVSNVNMRNRGASAPLLPCSPTSLHELSTMIHWSLAQPLLREIMESQSFISSVCGGDMGNTAAGSGDAALVGQTIAKLTLGMATNSSSNITNTSSTIASCSSVATTTATLRMLLNSVNYFFSTFVELSSLQRQHTQSSVYTHRGGARNNQNQFISPQQIAKTGRLSQASLFALGDVFIFGLTSSVTMTMSYAKILCSETNQGQEGSASSTSCASLPALSSVFKALTDATKIVIASSSTTAVPPAILEIARSIQSQCHSLRNDTLICLAASPSYASESAIRKIAEVAFEIISSRSACSSSSSTIISSIFGRDSERVSNAKTALLSAIEFISALISCEASSVQFGQSHACLLIPSLFGGAAAAAGRANGNDALVEKEEEEHIVRSEGLTLGWLRHVSGVFSTYAQGVLSSLPCSSSSMILPSASTNLLLNPSFVTAVLGAGLHRGEAGFSVDLSNPSHSDASSSATLPSSAYTYLRQLWLPLFEVFAEQVNAVGLSQPPSSATPEAFAARLELIIFILKTSQAILSSDVISIISSLGGLSSSALAASDIAESYDTTARPTGKKSRSKDKSRLLRSKRYSSGPSSISLREVEFVLSRILPSVEWILNACLSPIEQNLTYIVQTLAPLRRPNSPNETVDTLLRGASRIAVETVATLTCVADFYGEVCTPCQAAMNTVSQPTTNPKRLDAYVFSNFMCSETALNLVKLIGIASDEAGDPSLGTTIVHPETGLPTTVPPASHWQMGLLKDEFTKKKSGCLGASLDTTNENNDEDESDGNRFVLGSRKQSQMQMWRDESWHNFFSTCFTVAFGCSSKSNTSAVGENVGSALLAFLSNPPAFVSTNSSPNIAKVQTFYRLLSSVIGHSNPNDPFTVVGTDSCGNSTTLYVGSAQSHIQYVLNRLRTSNDVGETCGLWQQLSIVVSIIFSC